jgi:hypothetical protein
MACIGVCVNATTFAVSVVCCCIRVLTVVYKLLLRWLAVSKDICRVGSKFFYGKQQSNKSFGPCASRLHPSHLKSSEAEYAFCTDMGVFYYARKCTACVRMFGIFETPFVIKSSLSERVVRLTGH